MLDMFAASYIHAFRYGIHISWSCDPRITQSEGCEIIMSLEPYTILLMSLKHIVTLLHGSGLDMAPVLLEFKRKREIRWGMLREHVPDPFWFYDWEK